MAVVIVVLQGLFEIIGLGGFLVGFFLEINWLMMAGGVLVVLDDLIEMSMGILNPLLPIIVAVVLALIIKPWYVGIFWASSAFKVLGIPTSFNKVFAPNKHLSAVLGHSYMQSEYNSEMTDDFNSFYSDEIRICPNCSAKNKVSAGKPIDKAICGKCKQSLQLTTDDVVESEFEEVNDGWD